MAQSTLNDSVRTRELDEVVVLAPDIIKKGESTVFYPDKHLKETTKNANQVIAGLQIPELIVDLSSGTISVLGKDNLLIHQFRQRILQKLSIYQIPEFVTKTMEQSLT